MRAEARDVDPGFRRDDVPVPDPGFRRNDVPRVVIRANAGIYLAPPLPA
jgi:hypothetical protein